MEAKLIKTRIEQCSIHMSHIPLTHNRVCAANGLICPDNRKKWSWRLWLFGVSAGFRQYMYKVFMQLRIQTCSNDVLSVYSSAVTNSSERSGGTEGLEIQDWRLQNSIIVTICTWKCFSYCHTEESLSHMQAACNAGNIPPSWWPCSTSRGRIPPPAT